MDPYQIVILVSIGLCAGVINTLAGGGSNLSLPALMMFGLPADIANATNRVSVLLQSLTASRGFYKHNKISSVAVKDTFLPLFLGGLFGAIIASYMSIELLKPLLLGTMICLSLWVVMRSDSVPNNEIEPISCSQSTTGFITTFLAGFYGGFVQAGVGFVLIATFVGVLKYDLLRANALKVVAAVIFTSIALVVFIIRDQVAWVPGLTLAIGSIVGAQIAVKFAISIKAKTLKWLVFLMTLVASIAALII
ncbi:sulfite exporter TauE/SafE family protein [Colwelliaceae bacterium 6471]